MEILLLAAAILFGALVNKFYLPPLIGFLAAGFLLHSIGMQSVSLLETLTNIGIQLLLFCIGLKLDVKYLVKKEIWLGTSLHTLFFVIISCLTISAVLYVTFSNFSAETFHMVALIMFMLSFSSTVCVVKILEDKSELKTRHGQICLSVLIMQDIIAVAFLTFSTGKIPSVYALGLLALPIAIPLLDRLLKSAGHNELLPLTGIFLALAGGALFELVGMKADLGALVFGILLSQNNKSVELAKSLGNFKDVFLVGFFLSIGFVALPDWQMIGTSLLILLILPLKAILFYLIFTRFGLRARTAVLSSVALANFSEFGLIVAALANKNGWLANEWMVILALSMSFSFIITAVLNTYSHRLYAKYVHLLKKVERQSLVKAHPLSQATADILIIGMGRVGMGSYDYLAEHGQHTIIGIDADDEKIKVLKENEYRVYHADSEDYELWEDVDVNRFKIILMALPSLPDLLDTHRLIKDAGFEGEVCAIVKYPDHKVVLEDAGVNAAYNLYEEAGFGLAGHAIENLALFQEAELAS